MVKKIHPIIKPSPPNGVQIPNKKGTVVPDVINMDIANNEPLKRRIPAIKQIPARNIQELGILLYRIPAVSNANTW